MCRLLEHQKIWRLEWWTEGEIVLVWNCRTEIISVGAYWRCNHPTSCLPQTTGILSLWQLEDTSSHGGQGIKGWLHISQRSSITRTHGHLCTSSTHTRSGDKDIRWWNIFDALKDTVHRVARLLRCRGSLGWGLASGAEASQQPLFVDRVAANRLLPTLLQHLLQLSELWRQSQSFLMREWTTYFRKSFNKGNSILKDHFKTIKYFNSQSFKLPCWRPGAHQVYSYCCLGTNPPDWCSPSWDYPAAPVWGHEGAPLPQPSIWAQGRDTAVPATPSHLPVKTHTHTCTRKNSAFK